MTETMTPQGDTFRTETMSWVTEPADLAHLVATLEAASTIVYDLETTGLDEHAYTHGPTNGGVSARVVLASYTLPVYDEDGELEGEPSTYVVPLSHPESPWRGQWRKVFTEIGEAMRSSGALLVGHNVKFDHRWQYATTGVDLSRQPLWDTKISAHLVDENTSTRLKERAPDTFGVPRWDDVELTTPGAAELEPIFKLGEYAARDTYWTWKLYENHRSRMVPPAEERDMLQGEEIEEARLGLLAEWCAMPTVATLTSIEQRGIGVDTDWVARQIAEDEQAQRTAYDTLRARYVVKRVIDEETGETEEMDPSKASFAPTSHYFAAWTAAAVENGDLRIAALTPGGKPQWSKEVLEKQARHGSDIAEVLLTYRNATKRLEYLRSWLDQATQESRIHTNYNAGSVVTGRLSSSGPNMQQVTKALKPAFVPSPGHYLVDLDYSQIELRVAAFISRAAPMLEAFREEDDLHLMISGRTNSDKTLRAASMYLMWCGLPADRTGAQVLRELRRDQGVGGLRAQVAKILREEDPRGEGQASRSGERWCAEWGGESPVEGRQLPAEVPEAQEALLRELRSSFEREGWPWEWEVDDAGRASPGPQSRQQRPLELDDAVQVVSSTTAPRLSELTGDDWGKIRQAGKAQNFGLIYGMGAMGFRSYAETAYGVVMTEQEAAQVHEAYFEMWDGLRKWHLRQVSRVNGQGQVVSPLGRVRRLPDVWDGNEKRVAHAERNAINSPVQGMASDIMQIAAACIEGNIPGVEPVSAAQLVGTVHDSILVEVPIDRWEETAAACKRAMELEVPQVLERLGCEFDVPLVADAVVSTRWGLEDIGEM